jgi:hypothetical protein
MDGIMEETESVITATAGSIQNDFILAAKLFSQYLQNLKHDRKALAEISHESETLLKTWGNPLNQPQKFLSQGNESSSVFIIDSYNYLFTGESGALLKKILAAMTLSPNSVFLCNCDLLSPVKEKIEAGAPKVIITFGEKASQTLLESLVPLEKLRGQFHDFQGIRLMPTFHPATLLKNQSLKRYVWEDMKQVMKFLGLGQNSKL